MKKVALCSSMSFYKELISIGEKLEERKWKVLYPKTALLMLETNNFNVDFFKKDITFAKKQELMKLHFEKIMQADCILVVNKTKNNIRNYTGPNVLMEIGLAFHLNKEIYILNPILKTNPFYEELLAVSPIIINGNINKLM